MKKTIIIAAASLFLHAAASADTCVPLTTDQERVDWWCQNYPGPNCQPQGRLMLPYLSPYVNCPNVDVAGRPMTAEDQCLWGPNPQACGQQNQPTTKSLPANPPKPPAGTVTPATKPAAPGTTAPAVGSRKTWQAFNETASANHLNPGSGFKPTPGFAPNVLAAPAAPPSKPEAVPTAGSAAPVLTAPSDCNPIVEGNLMVFKYQHCMFPPYGSQQVDGGHAPLSWSTSKDPNYLVGTGAAVGFRPQPSSYGYFSANGTPAVTSSPYCQVRLSIVDSSGSPVPGCSTLGNTGDAGVDLMWLSDAASGCRLNGGQQYFITYVLTRRECNRFAPPDLACYCGMTVDAGNNIED